MRRRILSIGTTDIYLHTGTALVGVYASVRGNLPALAVSMVSVLLHEGAHAAASVLCGQPPREIELTPLGAVLRLEDEERLGVLRRALVIAAGPLMSLLICLLSLHGVSAGWIAQETGRMYYMANAAILMINLLPALPLDGGRLLALLMTCFLRPVAVRRIIRIMGTMMGIAVIGASVWFAWQQGSWNWSLTAVGCFLLYSASTATTTAAMAQLRILMDRKILLESRGHVPCRWVAMTADQPLHRAIRFLPARAMTCFMLVEAGTMRRIGVLEEQEVIAGFLEDPDKSCIEVWKGQNI